MTNEQIKNLLEKALQRSKKEGTVLGTHDVDKLVIQIELIINMLEDSSPKTPVRTGRDIGDLK